MNSVSAHDESPQRNSSVEERHGTRDRWLVLIVDDEPEIHEITRLVLGSASFSGLPVELYGVYSASEAMAFLDGHRDTALMLLDVVMETDDAGLRLIRYIREEMGNLDLQIVVRTGQPGIAPEREVTAVYDVNGYFLKTELVAQKLQSIVISSLRAYKYIKMLRRRQGGGEVATSAGPESYRRQALEEQFATAIDANAPLLLAQGQFNLVSGGLAAIEILPHWKMGDVMLGPAQLADEVRDPELRLKFDDWLFGQGSAWMRSWAMLDLPPFRISLPILSESIGDCRILSIVDQHFSRALLSRGTLDLIVPEAVLLRDQPNERDAFTFLKSIGVSITLVDFGLGLLSLPHLQRLLPDRVKIHKSFVRNVVQHRERAAIARSIIALAHTLGVTVIADGVMSEQDLQFFKWEGCDIGQGDLLGRPSTIPDVIDTLRSSPPTTH